MQKQTKWIGLATAAHLIVDMCCACLISMLLFTDTECRNTCKLHIALQNPALYLLLYNFCAFALQMPIGYLTDRFCKDRTETVAAFGCLLVASSFLFSKIFALHSVAFIAAGTGNALFHIGADVNLLLQM